VNDDHYEKGRRVMPYPWPASALGEDEMAMLFRAREASLKHMPITKLIRHAVVQSYGKEIGFAQHINEHLEPVEKAA